MRNSGRIITLSLTILAVDKRDAAKEASHSAFCSVQIDPHSTNLRSHIRPYSPKHRCSMLASDDQRILPKIGRKAIRQSVGQTDRMRVRAHVMPFRDIRRLVMSLVLPA
jgi:hypothetical protein